MGGARSRRNLHGIRGGGVAAGRSADAVSIAGGFDLLLA